MTLSTFEKHAIANCSTKEQELISRAKEMFFSGNCDLQLPKETCELLLHNAVEQWEAFCDVAPQALFFEYEIDQLFSVLDVAVYALVSSNCAQVNTLVDAVTSSPEVVRLVSFNILRQERLYSIPADQQYLFPWYAIGVDVRGDALEVIAQNWDALASGEWPQAFLEDEPLMELTQAVVRDKALLHYLSSEFQGHNLLMKAVESSIAVKLTSLITPVLPEEVASQFVSLGNPAPAIACEKLLLVCMGAEGLSNKTRIALLKQVDRYIHANNPRTPLLDAVVAWHEGRSTKLRVSHVIKEQCLEVLSQSMSTSTQPLEKAVSSLVEKLDTTSSRAQKESVIDRAISWLKSFQGRSFTAACAVALVAFFFIAPVSSPELSASINVILYPQDNTFRSATSQKHIVIEESGTLQSGDMVELRINVSQPVWGAVYYVSNNVAELVFHEELTAGDVLIPGNGQKYQIDSAAGHEEFVLLLFKEKPEHLPQQVEKDALKQLPASQYKNILFTVTE